MNWTFHFKARCLFLLLFAAACCYLLIPALDIPTQEGPDNILSTLRATAILTLLALCAYLTFRHRIRLSVNDLFAAMLFAVITICRFYISGPATEVRYAELFQVAMLYVSLRVIFMADPRTQHLLLMLLCVCCIYEAGLGVCQVYGFAHSNHGLFKVTGTLFNPGPFAGFIAPIFISVIAYIVRTRRNITQGPHKLKLFCSNTLHHPPRRVGLYLLCWCAASLTLIIIPATMSRAALIAIAIGGVAIVLREFDFIKRLRRIYIAKPLKTGIFTAGTVLLICGIMTGVYLLKRPSADGRLLIWKIDCRILLHNPLLGVGLGNFAGAFGKEQADYFASKERSEVEKQVAGCPESGFNEFLHFGAETGGFGLILLLLMTGTAVVNMIRRSSPFGYGLLTAVVFACFSYPGSVLPLRLLFVLLLAGNCQEQVPRFKHKLRHHFFILLLCGSLVYWPELYKRTAARVDARRQWNNARVWINSERYDNLIEDGDRLHKLLEGDFRFLYDYGYALHKTGNYLGSNEILQQGMKVSSDPMFWNIAGKNHEAMGDFATAEKSYLYAHYMIPDRVYPLYLLAKLYHKTGEKTKAYNIAQQAVGHIPKIESVQTREMQAELRELIDMIRRTEKED